MSAQENKKKRDISVVFARALSSSDNEVRRKAVRKLALFFKSEHDGSTI